MGTLVEYWVGWWACVLTGWAVGTVVLRRWGVTFHHPLERWIVAVALGWGLWGWLWFLLGWAGALRVAGLRVGTALVLVALGGVVLRRLFRREGELPRGGRSILLGVGASALYWFGPGRFALYPPHQWDDMTYHLVHVHQYLAHGRVAPVLGATVPIFPPLNHVLMAWAAALKDDVLAVMLEHTYLLLTAGGLWAGGLRWGWSPGIRLAAVGVWMSQPLVQWLGHSAYVDLALSAYGFLAGYALWVALTQRDIGWWWVSVSMLGYALDVKLTGWMFVPLWLMGVGLLGRGRYPPRSVGLFTVLAGLLWVGPVYAYMAVHTGSPFWPVLRTGTPTVWNHPLIREVAAWIQSVRGIHTPWEFLRMPLWTVTQAERFLAERPLNVLMGGFYLALLGMSVSPLARYWMTGVLGFTFLWALQSQQLRFWVPALPGTAASLGASLDRIARSSRPVVRYVGRLGGWTGSLLAVALWMQTLIQTHRDLGPWPLTPADRTEFYRGRIPAFPAVEFLQTSLRPGDRVYMVNAWYLHYFMPPDSADAISLIPRAQTWGVFWNVLDGDRTLLLRPDRPFGAWLARQGYAWVFIHWAHRPRWMDIPPESDLWTFFTPVWMDAYAWVFRRHPHRPASRLWPVRSWPGCQTGDRLTLESPLDPPDAFWLVRGQIFRHSPDPEVLPVVFRISPIPSSGNVWTLPVRPSRRPFMVALGRFSPTAQTFRLEGSAPQAVTLCDPVLYRLDSTQPPPRP